MLAHLPLATPLLAPALLAVATNTDNFAVAVACGTRRRQIRGSANLAIATLSALSTGLAMACGDWLGRGLEGAIASHLGSLLLVLLGTFSLGEWLRQRLDAATPAPATPPTPPPATPLAWREAIALGLALTATNLGTGIGAGLAQFNLVWVSGCSFLTSLGTIGGGVWLGRWAAQHCSGSRLSLLSGLLLIGLGCAEFV